MERLIKCILEKEHLMERSISIRRMQGGCINDAFYISDEEKKIFVKINTCVFTDMFEKEALGLKLLKTAKVNVPDVIAFGKYEGHFYLILSLIPHQSINQSYWKNFGNMLAKQHLTTNENFGLHYDNYIGALPQRNSCKDNWTDFFIENRITPLLEIKDHSLKDNFEKLFKKLKDLLPEEKPSLLHGDLWSGNILCGQDSIPYVVDPAVYFGHREMELAFTTLFGGFDTQFYEAYNEQFPLQPGYKERYELYNIYPLLVHHHLFGGNYLNQVRSILKRYV